MSKPANTSKLIDTPELIIRRLVYNEITPGEAEELINRHRKAEFDPFYYVEPCEPECSKERQAYHQGQWDMAVRMEQALGYKVLESEE